LLSPRWLRAASSVARTLATSGALLLGRLTEGTGGGGGAELDAVVTAFRELLGTLRTAVPCV
jgi:hypothetical protein